LKYNTNQHKATH